MKLPVLSVADGAGWEERLVAVLGRGSHSVEIARRCVDVVDLLAVAASGQGRAALLASSLRHLDTETVDRLRSAAVVPIAVVPRGDETARARMHAIGIEHLVPDDADTGVIVTAVAEAVRSSAAGPRADDRGAARSFADPSTSLPLPPGAGTPVEPGPPDRRGTVIAVWGPTGAPGRTTVATALADEIARLAVTSLLIDADVYGGTVSAVLGLLDESPGLAAACRQAGSRRLDAATLAALCWQLGPHLRVLTGIPLPSRWPELRPSGVAAVLAAARTLADYTVVDCGFCLETDEELSFDTLAPRRNGATLAVLDDADVIVVVGAADPIGMQRLVRGLADLRDAEVPGQIRVVLNRVRPGVVPGDPTTELRSALERFSGYAPAAFLPADTRALDTALATGRLLGEASPAGPLRRAAADLAAALAGVDRSARRRRRRRR